ncbi:MAG: NUDIX domain-containing protein [Pseudomonadota bacterium]
MTTRSPLRVRRAARCLVISSQNRVLLFRFDVRDRPPFWVTPGGECERDESFADAARRELFEETGITADPGEEVAQTTPQFITVEGEPVQADERYFLVRVADETITTAHHTALEQQVMTQHRWFTMAEIGDWPEAVFPLTLGSILSQALDR